MSNPSFVAGQRWVSNTESELGLGIVIDTVNRRVELSFPASGERRTYATSNAPLSRVRYEVGQQVESEEGLLITIEDVFENNGCLIYNGLTEAGDSIVLPEIDLNSFVQFSKPQDRLFAGQIDKNRAFQLRCETLDHIRQQQQSPVRGLLGPRVQLLPHQLYIAHEASNRYAPRVLLADEVGLGKTIEAGLILHQQLISGRAKRVLIVVPESLLHQWLVEMLRRFNLMFTILDEERCQGIEEKTTLEDELIDNNELHEEKAINPFDSAQLVLCTLPFLSNNSQRRNQALAAGWDLLIVDEAHHLQWSEEKVSVEYQAIEALSQRTKGLLLLTATPEQLGVASHFARLRLLDPDRYYDLSTFIQEEKKHQPVNKLVQSLLADNAQQQLSEQSETLEQLQQYLGDESVARVREALLADADTFVEIMKKIIDELLDRHGTGRVLFRNTRSSVAGFPERHLHQYPLTAPDSYETDSQQDVKLLLAPELLLGSSWLIEDPRVDWFIDWLKQYRTEKILVICARAETALTLEEHIRSRHGAQSAVFHEGLSLVARDRAAAYFADAEEGAQVLICSEIGSEGRNFQFAHHLVLFDLPLNPDLLEQRIGRLDRIGQRHPVEIHVPFYEHSAQAVLLRWYHDGINAFEKTCPAGSALYDEFKQGLTDCLLNVDDKTLASLIEKTTQRTQETLKILQQGRDRLLELNSCNTEQAETIVENMVQEERRQELTNYMEQVFDQFGVDQEHHSASSVILRPSDHMVNHSFPNLPEEGVTATYSRTVALSREDMYYLSWEHPMVIGAMDMVLNSEFGNTAFCTMKLAPLKPGTIIVEAIFVTHCAAPAELQLQRYLPLTTLRIVVDSNDNDLSQVLTEQHFEKLGKKVAKRNAQELVAHARDQIVKMVTKAEQLSDQHKATIVGQATERINSEQDAELNRLKALAKVNANIRDEEIQYLEVQQQQLLKHLQHTQIKLDAIRVALITG